MSPKVLTLIFALLVSTGCAAVENREQIGVLIDLGNDQKAQEKLVEKEDSVFSKAKEAVLDGEIAVGMSSESVQSRLGEPVLRDESGGGERWVYKAGNADWLKGEIIRIYFDSAGQLKRWTCANLECPTS